MKASASIPDFSELLGWVSNLNVQLPEWAQHTVSWLSEAPAWATAILGQNHMYFHVTLNAELIIGELESLSSGEATVVQKMLDNPKFRLHAFPGTQQRLTDWSLTQSQNMQAKIQEMLLKIPETHGSDLHTWNEARRLFPIIADKTAPFLAMTFAFGEHVPLTESMPLPTGLKLWDLSGSTQLLTNLQQGAVTFYVCELNLSSLLTLLLQFTTVIALSVVKWMSQLAGVLKDLIEGAVDGLKKNPKEVLLALLGALAAAWLIPALRNQLGDWMKQGKVWFEANYAQLMKWAGQWANEMQGLVEWFKSLSLLGSLFIEQVSADLINLLQMFLRYEIGGMHS
jgi:hypothetical protein